MSDRLLTWEFVKVLPQNCAFSGKAIFKWQLNALKALKLLKGEDQFKKERIQQQRVRK